MGSSLDNWQTALRRQYYRRDPQSNPIGSEPLSASVKVEDVSVPPPPAVLQTEDLANKQETQPEVEQQPEPSRSVTPFDDGQASHVADLTSLGGNGEPLSDAGEAVESKDWLDLPMLSKLDSLHHLIEWQFHNPIRLRTAMKDDDETAKWVSSLTRFSASLINLLGRLSELNQSVTMPSAMSTG